jgi:hypothetical protein
MQHGHNEGFAIQVMLMGMALPAMKIHQWGKL